MSMRRLPVAVRKRAAIWNVQVSRPVRWQESVQRLLDEGVRRFVEVGPGKVLLGLIRRIDKSVTMLNVEDEKSVENALNALL